MRSLFFIALAASFAGGCNDETLSVDASIDMSMMVDQGPRIDQAMRMPNGVVCGSSTCNAPEVCCIQQSGMAATEMCVSPGQCPDGGAVATCDGPEDCPASKPNCGVTVSFTPPTDMGGAGTNGGNASCTDNNTPSFDLGNGTADSKLCHADADCAGYSGVVLGFPTDFDGCCSSARVPGLHFCAPSRFAGTGGFYTCP
jgi:hypothetical protein